MTGKSAKSNQSRDDSRDRRTRIADAALELLAFEGARGLTHRAVDRALALAAGSTSYYFRTRSALLLAAAERLVALDAADVDALSGRADQAAELVERWLTPELRTRSLARVELLLTAARDPDFVFMRKSRAAFIERAESAVAAADALESAAHAQTVVALVDGLLLHGLVVGPLKRGAASAALSRIRSSKKDAPARPRRAR